MECGPACYTWFTESRQESKRSDVDRFVLRARNGEDACGGF